ncbi:membrane protein [Orientia tsutsugamushi]|uniref:Membrane protein n=1 Tax=Orientia tsutsugamushi TaxID=784 RepID=A0A2R8F5C4_ORITS|nr:hypothetical protein [Orientia tsutsugamushi]SPM46423.1 membrane protein [Orientia tsutsugamushi]
MNVLKSILQPCYAVILAFVVLFSPSICTANNNIKFNASKVSIDTSPFYLKLSSDIATNYSTLEAGIGYRLYRHRMDVRLGFAYNHNYRGTFIHGNYYCNIIEGNKASIFVTGGLISDLKFHSNIGVELGVGVTITLLRGTYLEYLDVEYSTIANYRPLPIHIRFGFWVYL